MHGRSRFRVGVGASFAALVALSGCIEWEEPSTQAVEHPAGTDLYASSFLPGDIDGDGFEDLVGRVYVRSTTTTRARYEGIVLLSDGDGTFTQVDFPAGSWPDAVGDFDEDGIDDVVAVGPGNPNTGASLPSELFLGGSADGSRPRGLSADDTVALPDAREWDVGDFDGDGHLDLLRVTTFVTYYEVFDPWLNDGAATFTEHTELGAASGPINAGSSGYVLYERGGRDVVRGFLTIDTSPLPWVGVPDTPVGKGDIDGDGSDDWVVVEAGELRFYRWDGTTNVAFPDYQDLVVSGTLGPVELLDLDGDGLLDLTYTDDAGRHTFAGTGDGGFPYGSVGDHGPPAEPSSSADTAWVDLDGDGLVDAVTASPDRQSLVVHMNTSTPVG
ncbi:MAG: VCBS repeat-containing protein [Actinobacteria bacterium]|nr:VCBS repeat-containing protein [Actinomycetota bacterium]